MLVTFHTKNYADITMFGDVAIKLLRMTGHSGTVPSAIAAADVPGALTTLKAALEAFKTDNPDDASVGDDFEGDPIERPVGLAQRAFPLIELLESAAEGGNSVMWE